MISLESSSKRSAPRKVVIPSSIECPKQQQSFQLRVEQPWRASQFETKKFRGDAAIALRNFKEGFHREIVEDRETEAPREGKENRLQRRAMLKKNFQNQYFSRVDPVSTEREETQKFLSINS